LSTQFSLKAEAVINQGSFDAVAKARNAAALAHHRFSSLMMGNTLPNGCLILLQRLPRERLGDRVRVSYPLFTVSCDDGIANACRRRWHDRQLPLPFLRSAQTAVGFEVPKRRQAPKVTLVARIGVNTSKKSGHWRSHALLAEFLHQKST
jgi:hypothetical protein